jgi:hypothetical protein
MVDRLTCPSQPVTAVIAQKTGGSGLVVKFTTSVAGDYTITLNGKGKPLQHSPIVVSVKAGNPNDAHVPAPVPASLLLLFAC